MRASDRGAGTRCLTAAAESLQLGIRLRWLGQVPLILAKALAGHSPTALLDMWAATGSTDNGSTASAVRRTSDDASGGSERSSVDHAWHVRRQRRLSARSAVGRASSG